MNIKKYNKHSLTIALVSVVLLVVAFGAGVAVIALVHKDAKPKPVSVFPQVLTLNPHQLIGKSAIVYDPTDGRILFSKYPDMQLPLASVTKLMTATVLLNSEATNTPVHIVQTDLNHDGNWGLHAGDTISLSSLLKLGLIASSNDAMIAAAGSVGAAIPTMNQTATQLGLSQTYFLNPSGLDESTTTAGAYSSAYDVGRLAANFFKNYPDYFELTQSPAVSVDDEGRTLAFPATALPILTIPGLLAAKTGYTDLAGGNLVAVFDIEIGHPLVAVVLGSTENGRFDDIRTLITAARAAATTTSTQ